MKLKIQLWSKKSVILNCNHISEYYWCYCIFDGLMSRRDWCVSVIVFPSLNVDKCLIQHRKHSSLWVWWCNSHELTPAAAPLVKTQDKHTHDGFQVYMWVSSWASAVKHTDSGSALIITTSVSSCLSWHIITSLYHSTFTSFTHKPTAGQWSWSFTSTEHSLPLSTSADFLLQKPHIDKDHHHHSWVNLE